MEQNTTNQPAKLPTENLLNPNAWTNEELEERTRNGMPWPALLLAIRHMEGRVATQNFERAYALLRFAAESGVDQAGIALGELHRLGKGAEKNLLNAVGWWGKAVPSSLLTISELELCECLTKASNAPEGWAQFSRTQLDELLRRVGGYYLRNDAISTKQHGAIKTLKLWGLKASKKCFALLHHAGDRNATYQLGLIHLQGLGLPPTLDEGLAYLEDAAGHGHHRATVLLGACYVCGLFGAPVKRNKGLGLLLKALDQATEPGR